MEGNEGSVTLQVGEVKEVPKKKKVENKVFAAWKRVCSLNGRLIVYLVGFNIFGIACMGGLLATSLDPKLLRMQYSESGASWRHTISLINTSLQNIKVCSHAFFTWTMKQLCT